MGNYHVVLADDHALFRLGLKGLIHGVADLEVVGEAGDGLELLKILKSNDKVPHLVILDISMPNLRGHRSDSRNQDHPRGAEDIDCNDAPG